MGKQRKLKLALSLLMTLSVIGGQVSSVAAETVTTENDLVTLNRGQGNLIIDSDFEAGGNAWNKRNQGIIADNISYNSGSKSGCVPSTAMSGDNVSGYIGQIVNVEKNTNYVITGYVKSDVDGAKASIAIRENNDDGTIIKETSVTSTEWEKFTLEINSGNNSTILVQLVKWAEPNDTGYNELKAANIYIDAVSVKKVNQNIITNSSFEDPDPSDSNLRKGWKQTGQGQFSKWKPDSGPSVAATGEWYGLLPTNTNNACVYQSLTLKPNTDYIATAKVQIAREGACAFFNVKDDQVSQLINNAETTVNCTKEQEWQWQDVELRFNTGNNTNVTLCVMKWCDANDTNNPIYLSQMYVDDVTLREVTTEVDPNDENYTMIWADDFNESSLDTSKWEYELGCIRGEERQHYVNDPENVFIRDGELVLKVTDRAEKDQYQNPRNTNKTITYNSGSVRTHGHQEFLYGRIEIKAKLPKGQGTFPAFWTLGSDFVLDGKISSDQGYGWARCGEIDIMEFLGGADGTQTNKQVWQTVHTDDGTAEDNGKLAGVANTLPNNADINEDYHIFGLNWSPNKLEWYIDDRIVCSVDYSDTSIPKNAIAQKALNRPHYVQLNLATGGAWIEGEVGSCSEDLAGAEFAIDYIYYAQNAEQKAAAEAYYADAPKLSGVKNMVMTEGDTPDLLKDITINDGYYANYSIENSPMFVSSKPEGGQTTVDLLCKGKNDTDSLAKLKAGTYALHYSGIPNEVPANGDRIAGNTDYKFDRKTVTLTVTERTFPSDWELIGEMGEKLSTIALPDGWSWDTPDLILKETGSQSVTFTNGSYTKTLDVTVTVNKVNISQLQELINAAEEKLKNSSKYTDDSIETLNEQLKTANDLLSQDVYTQSNIDKATQDLQSALDGLVEKPSVPTTTDLEKLINEVKVKLADENKYTAETVEELKTQLELAEKLLTENPTQDQIDAMKTQLKQSLDGLVEKEVPNDPVVITTDLEQLIQDIQSVLANENKYTAETVEELKVQLELAEKLLTENPTQDQIDAMKTQLKQSLDGLVEKEVPNDPVVVTTDLEQLIQDIQSVLADENKYTAETVKELKEQLDLAEKLLTQNPTQTEVDEMLNILNTKFDSLEVIEIPDVEDNSTPTKPDKKPETITTPNINTKPDNSNDNTITPTQSENDKKTVEKTNEVKTSDNNSTLVYVSIMLLSVLAIISIKKRKEE